MTQVHRVITAAPRNMSRPALHQAKVSFGSQNSFKQTVCGAAFALSPRRACKDSGAVVHSSAFQSPQQSLMMLPKNHHGCIRPNWRCAHAGLVVRAAVMAPQPAQVRSKPALINGVIFRQMFDDASSTYSYLVACPETNAAILIDPVYEQVDRDLEVMDDVGVDLQVAANTHAHADHITGSGKLKALRPSVRSAIAAASGATGDLQLQDNDTLSIGSLRFRCISTPGHTNGCMSFYLPPVQQGSAGMLFTGDALLIKACGRTDFQQGNPGALYDNIHQKLFTLPDDTLVLPGHDYKGRSMSSVGEEKRLNPRLIKSRQEFIDSMNNLNLPHPKQISRALPANMKDGANFPFA